MDRCSFATVLVGSCALFREGLARILSAADFRIAAAVPRVDDAALGSLPKDQPILLIVDVGGDQAATIQDIRLFKGQYTTARVALVANHDQLSDGNIVAAFRAGADAYFLKPSCDTFIKSLELVILGETILPLEVLSFILHHYNELPPYQEAVAPPIANAVESRATGLSASEVDGKYAPRLSAREKCILRCLIEGDFEQGHRPQERHRRSHGEGPCEGDPSQDQGQQSHASRDLGDEQRFVHRWDEHGCGAGCDHGGGAFPSSKPDSGCHGCDRRRSGLVFELHSPAGARQRVGPCASPARELESGLDGALRAFGLDVLRRRACRRFGEPALPAD